MQEEKNVVKTVFDEATNNFHKMLSNYYPATAGGTPAEMNITHQFVMAFRDIYKNDANVYFEIPIKNKNNTRRDNHFDAFIFTKDIGFIIESKRIFDKKAGSVAIKSDISRIEKN